jgi:hypothetical protein
MMACACFAISHDTWASDKAPDWMQALKTASLPVHDDKADAVTMYAEKILTVKANGKMTTLVREAYHILRPDSPHAIVSIRFDDQTKIIDLHAWTIPVKGQDYAVKEKDALTVGAGQGFELVTDSKVMALAIPAAEPGALVGYEYEQEERPYFQEDDWIFQDTIPVREARYTLQLPAGWSYQPIWRNHAAVEPVALGENRWQWAIKDIKAVKVEDDMPPMISLAQQLVIKLVPVAGQGSVLESWRDLGNWYVNLIKDRREASPAIKQKVAELTVAQPTILGKIQALARFSQSDIRYVAILLGIGGVQPHPAAEIFSNRYGDCKDKATLLSTMLKEIGVESNYVIINAEHDVVAADARPSVGWFNHAILAIQLPGSVKDDSLLATSKHPALGNILFFDPTNEFIPFGQLPGYLQGNYAMLVRPDGTELVVMPVQQSSTNGVVRTAQLVLDEKGRLTGDVTARAVGFAAFENRDLMQRLSSDSERVKYFASSLANFFSSFRLVDFKVINQADIYRPIEYKYSFEADKYAKLTGDMLIIRPRILGTKSRALLEKDEKRENPVQFVSLQKDSDEFVVTLPQGYVVDDLPAPVNIDYPFASYHSKTEVSGNTLRYTRSFEIKVFTVPTDKLEDLKKFYREIYHDERANAVLVRSAH